MPSEAELEPNVVPTRATSEAIHGSRKSASNPQGHSTESQNGRESKAEGGDKSECHGTPLEANQVRLAVRSRISPRHNSRVSSCPSVQNIGGGGGASEGSPPPECISTRGRRPTSSIHPLAHESMHGQAHMCRSSKLRLPPKQSNRSMLSSESSLERHRNANAEIVLRLHAPMHRRKR